MIKLSKMRWAGHIACIGGERREGNAYKDLVENPEGKELLEIPRYKKKLHGL
jgi:hypothetical protein